MCCDGGISKPWGLVRAAGDGTFPLLSLVPQLASGRGRFLSFPRVPSSLGPLGAPCQETAQAARLVETMQSKLAWGFWLGVGSSRAGSREKLYVEEGGTVWSQ